MPREFPDLVVIRGEGAGEWDGVVFDRNEMPYGSIDELKGRTGREWEPTGEFEIRADGSIAEVYRVAAR